MINKRQFFGLFVFALAFFMSACGTEALNPTVTGSTDYEMLIGSEVPDVLQGLDLENATLEDVTVDYSQVNVNRVGTYNVTITIAPEEVEAIVQVVTISVYQPMIPEIIGTQDLEYFIGEDTPSFLVGVTAFDYEYGDISHLINVDSSNIDFFTPGVYEVQYAVENIDGYRATETVDFTVLYDDVNASLPSQFILVEFNGKIGVMDFDGNELIEPIYDAIEYYGDSMLLLDKEGIEYFYNGDTKEIVEFEYTPESFFSDGLVVVENDFNRYGYMNREGEIVIPFIYSRAYSFSEGNAIIELGYNNYGTIDTDGNTVIPAEYSSIGTFIGGHVIVERNEDYFVLDDDQNILLELSSRSWYNFENLNGELRYLVYMDGVDAIIDEDLNIKAFTGDSTCFELNDLLNYGTTNGVTTFYYKNNDVLISGIVEYEQHFDMILYETEDGSGAFNASTGEVFLENEYASIKLLEETEDTVIVQNFEGMYGVVRDDGEVLFDFEATTIYPKDSSGYFFYEDSDYRYGLLNGTGVKITAKTYAFLDDFSDERARYIDFDTMLYGYLNLSGEEEIPPTFFEAYNYINGYASVKRLDQDNGWTVIGTDNIMLGAETYYNVSIYTNGFFRAQTLTAGEDYGYVYIDENNNTLPGIWGYTNAFVDGYATTRLMGDYSTYGLIDETGTVIVPNTFANIAYPKDDFVRVYCTDYTYGFYDLEGNEAIPCQYTNASVFSEGRAVVTNSNYQQAVIDKDNNIIIDFSNNTLYEYYEGFMRYYDWSANLYGFYDLNGDIVIPAQFRFTSNFENGLAIVRNENYEYGYINTSGELVIDYIYIYETLIDENGLAVVRDSQGYGIINQDGVEVLESSYTSIYYVVGGFEVYKYSDSDVMFISVIDGVLSYEVEDKFGNTYDMVYDDGWMLQDQSGTVLIPKGYDKITYFYSKDQWDVYKDNFIGFYDSEFNKVLDPAFENYYNFNDSSFIQVQLNGNEGIYNSEGQEVVAPIYDSVYYLSEFEVIVVRNGDIYGLFDQDGNVILELEYYSLYYIDEENWMYFLH